MTSYSVKVKEYRTIFKETISIYRNCVDYLITVCLNEWDNISQINVSKFQMNFVEHLIHKTNDNPNPKYSNFDTLFYKMPSYIRRAAIMEAIGKVLSYKTNFDNWKSNPIDKEPSIPKAGYIYPTLYRDNMYIQTDKYEARIKVYHNNTWDWITIQLRKSDMDYISRRCAGRKMCAPTLQKHGKCWYLNFPFEEKVALPTTPEPSFAVATTSNVSPDTPVIVTTPLVLIVAPVPSIDHVNVLSLASDGATVAFAVNDPFSCADFGAVTVIVSTATGPLMIVICVVAFLVTSPALTVNDVK